MNKTEIKKQNIPVKETAKAPDVEKKAEKKGFLSGLFNTKKTIEEEPLPEVKAKDKNLFKVGDVKTVISSSDVGINLIPSLTKEEIVVEKKKKNLNVGSIVSLLILVVVSILIVGFNIISKMQLNAEKEDLYILETEVTNMSQKIMSSNEITERALLYQQLQSENYSVKSVIDYINSIASKSGDCTVDNFTFGLDLMFQLEGSCGSLENISKFWYLLTNDSGVEEVTLKSVGNTGGEETFSFEGNLVLENFLTSSN